MRIEIEYQRRDLPRPNLQRDSRNCLFVGAGDSYASSLAAMYASSRALCCYPIDVVLNPAIATGRRVYIVSISGRTRANILVARACKDRSEVVAVTANPASKLAESCDRVIRLEYKSTGVRTAGTISFTASLLACLSLAGISRIPANVGRLYSQARLDAERVAAKMYARSSFIILANALLLPIAIYGSMKLNEIFGSKAYSYPAEEFCHAPLFSITKNDNVLVMGTPSEDGEKLTRRLRREGFSSMYIDFGTTDVLELLLQSTFFVQQMVLKMALRRKMTDCYFLKNKKLLQLSSSFIYH